MYTKTQVQFSNELNKDNCTSLVMLQKLCTDYANELMNKEYFCQSFKEGIDSLSHTPHAIYDQSRHFTQRLSLIDNNNTYAPQQQQVIKEISNWLHFISGRFC